MLTMMYHVCTVFAMYDTRMHHAAPYDVMVHTALPWLVLDSIRLGAIASRIMSCLRVVELRQTQHTYGGVICGVHRVFWRKGEVWRRA